MKMKRSFLCMVLAMVLLFSIALAGCSQGDKNETQGASESNSSQNEPTTGGSVTVGMTQDLVSLDPHQVTDAGTKSVVFNIFEGLVKITPEGDLMPAVAENYVIGDNADVITFTLRSGIKFQNGEDVTVEDIKYSLDRYAEVHGGSAFSYYKETVIKDDKTVEVHLTEPNSEFIYDLTVEIIPAGIEDIASNPVGTGPFKVVKYTPGKDLQLAKNEYYWQEGLPYLDAVTFKFIANVETAFNELQAHTINVLNYLTVDQVEILDKDEFTIVEGSMNLVHALYLNNEYEPFKDVRVRQAICYAINREQINDFLFAGASKYIGACMVPSIDKYFNEAAANVYSYDPEKAKDLLKQAGYEKGLEVVIQVPSSYTQHVQTAELIREDLIAVGIDCKIKQIEWNSWLSDVYQGRKYHATVIGVDGSLAPNSWFSRYQSEAGNNFVNYKSEKFDEVYAKASTTIDDAEKVELYKQLQDIMAEEAASAYIEDPADFVAIDSNLEGYIFYPMSAYDMEYLHFIK
ncbi:MAG: ABC transporter substrate-binding protein [Lachnospiraceae bacterium]|nr:ABC transporter substrate-binding protein [Lachnospiraceae bacterium]